jgi:MFS family permease
LRAFVGPKADHYLAAWGQEGGAKWNPAALLFGVSWLGYRKLWRPALIGAAILLVAGLAALFYSPALLLLAAALIGTGLWLGGAGNRLYRAHAEAAVADASQSEDRLRQRGGTSLAGSLALGLPVLALALFALVVAELRARQRGADPGPAPAALPTDGTWRVVYGSGGGLYQGDLEARGSSATLTVDFRTPDGNGRVRQDCQISGTGRVAIVCSNPQILSGPGPFAADSFDVQLTDPATMRGVVHSESAEPGEALFTRR